MILYKNLNIASNKILIGEFNESGELVIQINEQSDLLFFQEWVSQKKDIMLKRDYVRNFDFTNGYEQGTLFNCQPILHKNMNFVKLMYDYNSGHYEAKLNATDYPIEFDNDYFFTFYVKEKVNLLEIGITVFVVLYITVGYM